MIGGKILKFGGIVFAALICLVSGIRLFADLLLGGQGSLFFPLLFLVLFPGVFVLQALLAPSRLYMYVAIAIQSISPALLFLKDIKFGTMWIVVLGAVFMFVVLSLAYRDAEHYLHQVFSVRLRAFGKVVYHHVVSAEVLLLSVFAYLIFFVWGGGFVPVAERFAGILAAESKRVLAFYVPGISFDDSIDNAFRTIAEKQLAGKALDGGGGPSSLETEQRVGLLAEGLKNSLEDSVGPIDGAKSVRGTIQDVLVRFAEKMPVQFHQPVFLVLTLLFFWVTKSMISVFSFFGILFSWLVYKVFVIMGFVKMEKKMVEQERPVL